MIITFKNIEFDNIKIANTFLQRLKGLMFSKQLQSNTGLLLMNCPSIHCFFMNYPIDVIYFDKNMQVIYKETVHPQKMGKIVKGAKHVLEVKENMATQVKIGEAINIEGNSNE